MKRFYLFGVIALITHAAFAAKNNCNSLKELSEIPSTISQIILVKPVPSSTSKATVTACEKRGNSWQSAFEPLPAVIGTNGIAKEGMKKEGDKKTPAGIFPIGEAFGYTPLADKKTPPIKLDYRYIVDAKDSSNKFIDKFIDDPDSADYNTWIVGPTNSKSFEEMRRADNLYEFGLVINYNMHPATRGKGSAVFMHIWRGPDSSTAGCVALDKANIIKLLTWLDKSKQPQIAIVSS